jgi:DNA-nicking Smr family endonuclease
VPRKRRPPPTATRTEPSGEVPYKPFAGLKAMRDKLAQGERENQAPPPRVLPSSKAKGSEQDAEEEALALHRMMSGVTPLDSRPSRIPRSQASVGRRAPSRVSLEKTEADAVHEHLTALVESARFEVSDDGRRVEGRRIDLRPELLRKLRHGVLPIDARMDLHGMQAVEAREALERFLAEKRSHGERCVLVIHGKGEHSPRGQGVLRGEIAAWLSQGKSSNHVAAFATATDSDGGEGAVYVLLAR